MSRVVVILDTKCPILFDLYYWSGVPKQVCTNGNLEDDFKTLSMYVPPVWTMKIYSEYDCKGFYSIIQSGLSNFSGEFEARVHSACFEKPSNQAL